MELRAYKTSNGYRITNDRNESRLEPGKVMLTYSKDDSDWRVQRNVISPGTEIQERWLSTKDDSPLSSIVQDVKTVPFELFADIADAYKQQKSGCLGFFRKQPPLAEFVFNELERLSKK